MNNKLPSTSGQHWFKQEGTEDWQPYYVTSLDGEALICNWAKNNVTSRCLVSEMPAGQWAKAHKPDEPVPGSTSDGYHTFDELYEFRKLYNAALFNQWAALGMYDVHKSIRHNDGEPCFGGGWFIVVAVLPEGQISNHYKMEDWDLFQVPETKQAKHAYDGHTGKDVLERLRRLPRPDEGRTLTYDETEFIIESLEERHQPAPLNPMGKAWQEGVNEESEKLVKLFRTCEPVTIFRKGKG